MSATHVSAAYVSATHASAAHASAVLVSAASLRTNGGIIVSLNMTRVLITTLKHKSYITACMCLIIHILFEGIA